MKKMNWNELEIPSKPYYQDEWVTIYHGDCREILSELPKVDLVLTDPPYPILDYGWLNIYSSLPLNGMKQLVFWMNTVLYPNPDEVTAIHIWRKTNVYLGKELQYERILEYNGAKLCRIYDSPSIQSVVSAQMANDVYYDHPTQKPTKLISVLLSNVLGSLILDPFLGSGTTAYCAKKLNRKCIGIEIEEKYCEIAAKRCSQQVFDLRDPNNKT